MNKSRKIDVRLSIYGREIYRMAPCEPLAIDGISASLGGGAKAYCPLSTHSGLSEAGRAFRPKPMGLLSGAPGRMRRQPVKSRVPGY
jgi:hypothetical protein